MTDPNHLPDTVLTAPDLPDAVLTAPDLPDAVLTAWAIESTQLIADTRSSHVYRVVRRALPGAIVKSLKPEGMEELKGLHFLDWRAGNGAVRLLDQQGSISLLEDAGSLSLADHRTMAGEAVSVEIIIDVLAGLHAPSGRPHPTDLTPLRHHVHPLFRQAEDDADADRRALLRWSAGLAEELLRDQRRIRPLHGDLHHDNIMSHDGYRWRAIDPHGLIGDPAYDVSNIFGNPLGARDDILDPQRILFLANRFAAAMDDSAQKILKYAVVHAALSMCWSLERPDLHNEIENAEERHAFTVIGKTLLEKAVG